MLHLVPTLIEHNGECEHAIKCAKVADGVDTCTVAIAPHNFMSLDKVKIQLNKFVQASEICEGSKNTCKRSKAAHDFDIAAIKLLLEDKVRDRWKAMTKGHSFQLLFECFTTFMLLLMHPCHPCCEKDLFHSKQAGHDGCCLLQTLDWEADMQLHCSGLCATRC